MAQLGHVDPKVTLAIYARRDRRDGEPERLKALVQGELGQRIDSKAVSAANEVAAEPAPA
jgi:hypothetical protein